MMTKGYRKTLVVAALAAFMINPSVSDSSQAFSLVKAANAGWFKKATGIKTPKILRDIDKGRRKLMKETWDLAMSNNVKKGPDHSDRTPNVRPAGGPSHRYYAIMRITCRDQKQNNAADIDVTVRSSISRQHAMDEAVRQYRSHDKCREYNSAYRQAGYQWIHL